MSHVHSAHSVTLTYYITYKAAELSLEHARRSTKYREIYLINVYVMSAFSLEAYLNDFCAVSLAHDLWKDLEKKLNSLEKIKLLSAMLNIEVDFSRQPFQDVRSIFRIRDKFAHAKRIINEAIPESLIENNINFPENDINLYLKDIELAAKIHKSVYDVISYLHDHRANKDYDGHPLGTGKAATNITVRLTPKQKI